MKRVKRVFTHQRHWLWYGASALSALASAIPQIISPDVHPVAYLGFSVLAAIGGLVAHTRIPQDGSQS